MRYIFSFLSLLQLSLLSCIPLIIQGEGIEKTSIATFNEDLTNDGYHETIQLNGQLLAPASNYYHQITVDIFHNDAKQWHLKFSGGYDPVIDFLDLNNNGTNDLFYQSKKSDGQAIYDQHLYTLNNYHLQEIPLPKPYDLKGKFLGDFQAQIQISPLGHVEPIIVDISRQKQKYIKLGIYNHKGNLQQEKKLTISPAFLYNPVRLSIRNGYGLKSFQKVYGAGETDEIGVIETLWYYENDGWIILQTHFNLH